jgi:DNA processing protein
MPQRTVEPVHRWHFAARNRLVVGLSHAVVVVQSPAKGGALISAQLALDSGATCWVYRPDKGLDTPPWAGNRKLLDEFPSMGWHSVEALAERITNGHGIVNAFVAESGLPPAFRSTWRHITQTRGAQLDVLAMRTGTDAASLQKQLHAMELGGWYVPLKI